MTLTYKQGDTRNAIVSYLEKRQANGDFLPINLTGCKVYISVSNRVYEDECIILDATKGKVSYLISNISDTSGKHNYEYIIKYPDGTKEGFPNEGYEKVNIYREVIK